MGSRPATRGVMMHVAVRGKGQHDRTAENSSGLRRETGVRSSRALQTMLRRLIYFISPHKRILLNYFNLILKFLLEYS